MLKLQKADASSVNSLSTESDLPKSLPIIETKHSLAITSYHQTYPFISGVMDPRVDLCIRCSTSTCM
jgi:hypothetical protein